MNEMRKALINSMIRLYGSEDPIVASFRHLCETWPDGKDWDKSLRTLVIVHEECPIDEDANDE